ncbi:GTPase-associated protein 1-related protein [Streptomyces sp. SBT349]|uniref:GTPase-associated protein 1-related protein n=1 Tax=Streptomyces sp. SBT349 TaxID=1580539 RepID=UPI00066D2F03|nr:GTPase-associated protein 1-related protein [Streptomyces sp. SBT349]
MNGPPSAVPLRFALAEDPGTGRATARLLPGEGGGPGGLPPELASLVASAAPAPGDGSLGYARLPGGGGAVLCHVPADGSPARALFLPDGPEGPAGLPAPHPVDLWRSPGWADDERLVDFAGARARRVVPFLSDVARLFVSFDGRPLVVAEEEQETVALWIALASRFLDRFVDTVHAGALTFTTRAPRPFDAPQQIVGIGPDTDFDRGDPDVLLRRFRVHDGLGGEGSPPEPDPWVERAVCAWLVPPPERLRRAAVQLRGRPHELRGVPLFRMLSGRLPEGHPADAADLALLYELVWGGDDPDLAGALELMRACPPRLLAEAGVHPRLARWLTRPGEITDDRCTLARELLRHGGTLPLDRAQRAAAHLLIAGQDITVGGPAAEAAERFLRTELNRRDTPLPPDPLAWARRRLRLRETGTRLPPPLPGRGRPSSPPAA